jgi:LysM domain
MYKTIITPRSFCCLALLCCLALPALADDVQLQENHPDRYTVVKGDTLWGISGKFLKDPWQWPKVWKMNRADIKNPHRIYPGDVIALDMSSGSPELSLTRGTITLEPGVRIEALKKAAIPTISLSVISPFLSQPLVIENGALDDAATIISGPEDHIAFITGDRIYVDKIEEGSGTFWQIYRNGKALLDPATNEVLGTEAIYLGDVNVTHYGEPATVVIRRTSEDVYKDDKLITAPEEPTASFTPHAPDDLITGDIISIYNGVGLGETTTNSIVTIDRGSSDGLEEGHVLAIYRNRGVVPDPKAKKSDHQVIALPAERMGLLMIFRTFDRVSYGLIMQASGVISVSDKVISP